MSKIINAYFKKCKSIINRIDPSITDDEILKIIYKKIKSPEFHDDVLLIENNYRKTMSKINKQKLINKCLSKDYIMTGYGTLFYQHDDPEFGLNLNAELIKYLLADRKINKKKYFQAIDDKDIIKQKKYQMAEKTDKLLNNSFFGATGEKSSQFYNPDMGPSITYSGVQIITSSVIGNENFLSKNIKYNNFDDILIYIDNILNEEYTIEDYIDDIDRFTPEIIYNVLVKDFSTFKYSDKEIEVLNNVLNNLSKNELAKIYYKNNLYEFCLNSKPRELIISLIKNNLTNILDLSDEIKNTAHKLWEMIKACVFYDYQIYNRYKRALTMKRKSVLTVDTDSNFLVLARWHNFIRDNFYNSIEVDYDDKSKTYTSINALVLILTEYIQCVLNKLTSNNGINEDNQPTINMKNEFYYSRIMLTRNKKQYCGKVMLQECHELDESKQLDMKGMSIKKANVNGRTREVFTNLIKNDILGSKNIKLSKIYNSYNDFGEEIKNSLLSGNIQFLTPGKANEIASYKEPLRIASVRGSITYNLLYPENPIIYPTKVNVLKLNCDIDAARNIPDEKFRNIILDKFFNEESEDKIAITTDLNVTKSKLSYYGFSIISFPKSIEKIPDWIIPLIDIDTIIDDNLRNGIIMLQSLGFKTMKLNNKEYISNIISFWNLYYIDD